MGLTCRRTARRIKRLMEIVSTVVSTISPAYADRLDPNLLALSIRFAGEGSVPEVNSDPEQSGSSLLEPHDRRDLCAAPAPGSSTPTESAEAEGSRRGRPASPLFLNPEALCPNGVAGNR